MIHHRGTEFFIFLCASMVEKMPAKGMMNIRYLSPPVLAGVNPVKPILVSRKSTEYQFRKNPIAMMTPKTRGIFCNNFPFGRAG